MHGRQVIREAAGALLLNKTGAQNRVFLTRMTPWRTADLPALAVYTLEESSSVLFDGPPRVLERTLQLAVHVVVALNGKVDTVLDDLALQVEKLMGVDPTLGLEMVTESFLSSTAIEIVDDQQQSIGTMQLLFTVTYQTDVETS